MTYIAESIGEQYLFSSPDTTAKLIWLSVISTFFLVAPIEEFVKYWIAKTVVQRNKKYFTQIVDGIIYMVVAAAAFAFVENFKYFYESYQMNHSLGFNSIFIWTDVLNTFGLRAIATTLMHLATSGIFGFYWGLLWFRGEKERTKLFFKGFILAVLVHSLFNISLHVTDITNVEFGLATLVLAVAGSIYLFYKFKNEEYTLPHNVSKEEQLTVKPERPKNTTLLTIILILLLGVSGYIAYLGIVARINQSSYYYSVVILSDKLGVITRLENLEQCNIVRELDIENYKSNFVVKSDSCNNSRELNDYLSKFFSDEPVGLPYLSFTDQRGNEKRVIIVADVTGRAQEEALSEMENILGNNFGEIKHISTEGDLDQTENHGSVGWKTYSLKEGWSVGFPDKPVRTENENFVFYDVYSNDGFRYLISFINLPESKHATLDDLTKIVQKSSEHIEFIEDESGINLDTEVPFVSYWNTLTTSKGDWLVRSFDFATPNKIVSISVGGYTTNSRGQIESAFDLFSNSVEYIGD